MQPIIVSVHTTSADHDEIKRMSYRTKAVALGARNRGPERDRNDHARAAVGST
jgi:hypothetical protein